MDETVIDATERVLSRLESNEEVAYAEVGGVERHLSDAVITRGTVRSSDDLAKTGVWWRVFADGSADYRYVSSFDEAHLEDMIERSIRAAKLLDQSSPVRYDPATMHRDSHPGWVTGPGSLREQTADEKAERIRTAFADALGGLDVERTRVSYRDESVETTVSTTTGTTVRTELERASADAVVVPSSGPKLRRHVGSTTGEEFLDTLPARFEELARRGRTVAETDKTPLGSTEEREVVFGPLAAGALIHQLSHYLEVDMLYFGSSPFELGDRVGPSSLSIEDTIRAGSWAARAYDAEGRPTRPVSVVSNGRVVNHLYDVAAAIEEEAHPAGHAIPSLGFENPPRIHARHLTVEPGNATRSELCEGADVYVERLGNPWIRNEATRTKRESTMPPSVLYANDIAESTPSDFEGEHVEQEIHLPIEEAYVLRGGDRTALLVDGAIEFSLSDLQSITALGANRRTLTGTCSKHKSVLPFAVTAPAVRLSTAIGEDR
ncbi:MAG: metallopeptidase TldD-related protein [Halapricum sp.]